MRRADGGEAVFLEDEVRDLLDAARTGMVALVGPAGSGKSTALAHVAALVADPRLVLVDAPVAAASFDPERSLILYGTDGPVTGREHSTFALEPWGEDDWIEYLLGRHRDRCGRVLDRLHASPESDDLLGLPETCAPVLDALAEDDALSDALAAVERAVERAVHHADSQRPRGERVGRICLRRLSRARGLKPARWPFPADHPAGRLLRHAAVRYALASRALARSLSVGRLPRIGRRVPPVRLALTAGRILSKEGKAGKDSVEALRRTAARPWGPVLATALHHAFPAWKPDPAPGAELSGALLAGVSWPEIDLAKASISNAEMFRATLSGARLEKATARGTRLDGARLDGADLRAVKASEVRLNGADLDRVNAAGANFDEARIDGASLRGADLSLASLHRASLREARAEDSNWSGATAGLCDLREAVLTRAVFRDAHLEGADLRGAILAGADATKADLSAAQLEGATAPGIVLASARLDGADLTYGRLANAKCTKASFRRVRMAEVDLSGADLRHADLSEVEFHMGSARSGLVSTPFASEGTRTGFYADDFLEPSLLDPDSVRKADLRNADLRGAKIDGTDFFLVDLRGARLDPSMIPVLKGMRAILEDPPR